MLTELCGVIDAHDWARLDPLLTEDSTRRYVHTSETFDKDSWIQLNAMYPGFDHMTLDRSTLQKPWRCTPEFAAASWQPAVLGAAGSVATPAAGSVDHVDQPAQCRDVVAQCLPAGVGQPDPRCPSPRTDALATV